MTTLIQVPNHVGGFGGIDRQVTEKMPGPRFEYEDFVRLYDAFGVPEGEREEEKAAEDDGDKAVAASGDLEKKFRLQASVIMEHRDLCRILDHVQGQIWAL